MSEKLRKSTRMQMSAGHKHRLLLKVCEMGDMEQVNQLLQVKNIELKDFSGKTLIYCAIKGGAVDLVEFLLQKGASLKVQDNSQQNPLQHAVLNGSADVCKFLLKQQKDLHREEPFRTLIKLSIKARDLSMMETLLNTVVPDCSEESPGSDTLLYSCQFGDLQTTKSLLESRYKAILDINAVDKSGRNAIVALLRRYQPDADIHTALDNDQLLEMVKLVVNAGVILCSIDNYGWTPLHYAVYYNNTPAVQILLDLKHPRNVQSTAVYDKIPEMASALHIAILSHDSALVKLLCEHGVSCNLIIKQRTDKKNTVVPPHGPLQLAISERNLEIAQILTDHGANLSDLFGLDRKSVLHRIITTPSRRFKGEKIPLVVNLIERGIDVNSQDADGNTMLHVLFLLFKREPFSKGNFDDIHIAQLICDSERFVCDLLNRTRETALMVGVKSWHRFFINNNVHTVILLRNLLKCTDLNIADVNGDTVLHHAFRGLCSNRITNQSFRQLHEFIFHLLEQGCDRYRKNKMGRTPLHTFIVHWNNTNYFRLYPFLAHHTDLERQCVLRDDTDILGVTILHRALLHNLIPFIKHILANKHSIGYINAKIPCDISSKGVISDLCYETNLTALQIAATQYADCWSIIGILLKSGADVHMEFPEPMYSHKKTILEVIYECIDRQRLMKTDEWFFTLYQLYSAGAKYMYMSPTRWSECRFCFNKIEQNLLRHKSYLPMLQQVAILGYHFNYDYLINADFNQESKVQQAGFIQYPKVSIYDLEHSNDILRVIDPAQLLYALEVLAARVVRQNMYPNAWFAWKELQLPQSLLSTHFGADEQTRLPFVSFYW